MSDLKTLAREKAQKAVDREIAARAELAAAIDNRIAARKEIDESDEEALAFIDAYVNPQTENPAPLVPDVAAPPLLEEPPVYTPIDTATVDATDSSGGVSDVAPELTVVEGATS